MFDSNEFPYRHWQVYNLRMKQKISNKSSTQALACVMVIYLFMVTESSATEINIISKTEWDGVAATKVLDKLTLPVDRVVIMHTAGADCNDKDTCAQQVRNIQHFQMTGYHFDDIGYNFLVGNDGNVYEGRGWDQQGAFAKGFNAGSLGVTFIGTFNRVVPSEAALEAAKNLLANGINLGKLTNDYRLYGHRQLVPTNSPGDALYAIVKEWPHWTNKITS